MNREIVSHEFDEQELIKMLFERLEQRGVQLGDGLLNAAIEIARSDQGRPVIRVTLLGSSKAQ